MANQRQLAACKRLPILQVTKEPTDDGCYELITNHYWQVVDNCILLFRGCLPQCNSNESIATRLVKDVGDVRFLPKVWLEHECDL